MDYIITTEQLTKKYKNFISVNHVSLSRHPFFLRIHDVPLSIHVVRLC